MNGSDPGEAELSLGVLGCSSIARRRTLPAATSLDQVRIAAVASRSAERAASVAAEFASTPCGYDELIENDDIDAVYIGLPNALHHEWTRRALLAGKHVLCEKPLTGDPATTKDVVDLAAERGLVLRENFAFLHHPQHGRVRDLLASGRIGEIRTLSAAFGIPPLPAGDIRYDAGLGGGALLDTGVYPIRLARLLLGDGLSVVGAALRVDERLGVDVSGHALLVSAHGVLADLEFGFQHTYRCRYQLWGSTATLSLDRAFITPPEYQPRLLLEEQDHTETFTLPPAHQIRLSLGSFAEAALGGRTAGAEQPWLAGAQETARLVEEIRSVAVRVPGRAGAR
jgi:dTDP-3,4-didehydro-2,6-dideoxy-alpha-D-glucose 3-reductase